MCLGLISPNINAAFQDCFVGQGNKEFILARCDLSPDVQGVTIITERRLYRRVAEDTGSITRRFSFAAQTLDFLDVFGIGLSESGYYSSSHRMSEVVYVWRITDLTKGAIVARHGLLLTRKIVIYD